MATQNFKVNVSDFLGFQYQEHLEHMYSIAMSNPTQYYEIRKEVTTKVRNEIVERWFQVFYEVLTEGTITPAGSNGPGVPLHKDLGAPHFPQQETSKLAIGIGKTIQKISDDIVEKLIPMKYDDLARRRTQDKADALAVL